MIFIILQNLQRGSFKNGRKSRYETGWQVNALKAELCSKTIQSALDLREIHSDTHLLLQRFQNVVVIVMQKNGTQSWVFINLGFAKKVKLQVAQHFALKREKHKTNSFALKLLIIDTANQAVGPQQSEQLRPGCPYKSYNHIYLTVLTQIFLQQVTKTSLQTTAFHALALQVHFGFRESPRTCHNAGSDLIEAEGADHHCNRDRNH